jgi:hypothetical protein
MTWRNLALIPRILNFADDILNRVSAAQNAQSFLREDAKNIQMLMGKRSFGEIHFSIEFSSANLRARFHFSRTK